MGYAYLAQDHFSLALEEHAVLYHQDGRYYWTSEVYPAQEVTLRSATTDNFVIVDTTTTMLEKGCVGIFHRTNARLQLREGVSVEVPEAERLASLDLIRKKLDGAKLSKGEVMAIVKDTVEDDLSSMEMATYIAASYIHGMDMDEVEHLTRAMVATGERIQFVTHPIVDKHSIGGVPGNKITLIVVPIIAAAGLRIPKTSSRAITGAGGTADLMEVLAPVEFSAGEVKRMTEKVGGVIVWGGSTNIAPADDRYIMVEYPFRIDANGQMLASVMAKKYAVGADLAVIDIPVGAGTKVPTVQDGRKLAAQFMELGERIKIHVECALTYGESPVGRAIGPNLEVHEALAIIDIEPHEAMIFQFEPLARRKPHRRQRIVTHDEVKTP